MSMKVKEAIQQAKELAYIYSSDAFDWTVSVEEEEGGLCKVTVEVVADEPPPHEDSAWNEWGGNEIIAPLEDTGFCQHDCWLGVVRRRTLGGGEVEEYREGVLLLLTDGEANDA